ncbi:MAG: hypothetical protein IH591_01575, partial [Bacteroidales bacterium]|nr:hypothetical protein [Bacteroidales bacterium]
KLLSDVKTNLTNPINSLKKLQKDIPGESYVQRVREKLDAFESIDKSLPEIAENNREVLQNEVVNISVSYKYNLTEIADIIIVNETGSESLFNSVISRMQEKLPGISNRSDTQTDATNNKVLINKLREELDKLPSNEAVIARTLVLLIPAFIAIIGLTTGILGLRLATAGIVISLLGAIVFNWFASRSRINRLVSKIERNINLQYEKNLDEAIFAVSKEVLSQCLKHTSEISTSIQKVFSRFRTLTIFGKDKYEPIPPPESAFWMNIVNTREQALLFYNKIGDKKSLLPFKDFVGVSSLEIWNRISTKNDDYPNSFELDLIENLAIQFAPECSNLLKSSICEVLENDTEKLKNISIFLSKYCDPFTSLNILDLPQPYDAVFEFPLAKCEKVSDFLKKAISANFNLETKNSGSSFRISFFSFAEGISFENIINKLKVR